MIDRLTWGTVGPAVVLVHGSGLSALMWRRLGPALAARGYVTHAIQLTGYGSTPLPEPFTLADDRAVVRALLDEIGADLVLGHSYGGTIALQVAVERSLGRLVLFEPVLYELFGDVLPPDVAALQADPSWMAAGPTEAWMASFVDYWLGRGAWDKMLPARQGAQMEHADKCFREVMGLIHDAPPIDHYDHLTVPTLLVSGGRSNPDAAAMGDRLAARVASVQRHHEPAFGHMGPITHPDRVAALAAHFFQGD